MRIYSLIALLILTAWGSAYGQSLSLAYNDIRRFDQVVNLDPITTPYLIEINDDNGPYTVNGTRKIYANFMALTDSVAVLPNVFEWASVGIFPIYNSYASVQRSFDTKEALDAFELRVPYSTDDLEKWKNGDAMFYSVIGGVAMYLTAGSGLIGLGPKVSIEGGFSVFVEKKSSTSVFVEIRKVFARNYSLIAGTWGVYLESAKLHEATKGINFIIDISTEKGREVYEQIIKVGRIDFAQDDTTGVVRSGEVHSKKSTKIRQMAITTPFIPVLDFNTGRTHQVYNEHRNNLWGQESDVVIHEHMKKRSHRIFSKKGNTKHSLLIVADKNENISEGSLTILRERDHFRTKTLKRALRYLYKRTKIADFKKFEVGFGKEKLGFASVSAKLTFGQAILKNFTKYLQKKNLNSAVKKAKKYLKRDNFKIMHELVRQCGGSLEIVVEGKRIQRSFLEQKYSHSSACPF